MALTDDISRNVFDRLVGIQPADQGAKDLTDSDFLAVTTPRRRRASVFEPDPMDEEGVDFGDYAVSIMSGGASLAQGFGWLAKQVGAERIGSSIEELGRNAVDYWNDRLSDAAKDALSREFIRKNEETGEYEWGDATLQTVGLMGAQSLLGTAGGMGVGAGVSKVLQLFANPFGRSTLAAAARAGSEQAIKKLRLVDSLIGAAGFGVGEGLVGGTQGAISVDQAVRRLSPEQLFSNDRYRQVYESTDETMSELERHQYATDVVAREAASLAGLQSGLTTALLGAPMGAFFGRILGQSGRLASTRLRSAGVGAAGEAAQEAAQSAAEAVISGRIRQDLGEADLDLFEEAVNQAIGGAAAGAGLGGAVGAVDFRGTDAARSRTRTGKPDTQTPLKNAAMRAAQAGADREAVLAAVKDNETPIIHRIATLRNLEAAAEARAREPEAPPPIEVPQTVAEPWPQPEPPRERAQPTTLDIVTPVDEAAHESATSPLNELPEPTPAQKDAGNYPKGHLKGSDVGLPGYDISIENPRGSVRRGVTREGKEWQTEMPAHYGDLKGTTGADGEELDVYVGQALESDQVHILHQLNRRTGRFDEHKVLLGFASKEEAVAAVESTLGGQKNLVGPVVSMHRDSFLEWVQSGNTTKPHPEAKMPEGDTKRHEGSESRAITPAGESVPTRYALVELPELIASHSFTGRVNPDFPQELQPRDRTRAGLKQWIVETAGRFEPALAVEGASAGEGAPIIGQDNVVESGNGRVAVISKLYHDDATAYKDYLAAHAQKFGLTREQVEGMDRPVLVRVRKDVRDMAARARFATEANRPALATFSATEQANADAKVLTDDELALFAPDAAGSVLAASNERFVRAFVSKLPATERAGLMTAEGQPTRQLANRIQAAIFAKAYQDDRVLTLMAEEANPDVRNVVAALTTAAPAFARARAAGVLGQADVVEPLLAAVEIIRQTSARGQAIPEYLDQQGLFEQIPPEVDRMARFIDTNIRSAKRMGEAFAAMAEFLESEAVRRQSGALFGEEPELDVGLAMQAANQRMQATYGAGAGQAALFERTGIWAPTADPATIPRDPELSPEMKAIEDKFARELAADIDGALERYAQIDYPDRSRGGKIISTDIARELSEEYRNDRTLSAAVHEPASWLMKIAYARRLAQPLASGDKPYVLFMAGGTGAGKTSSLREVDALLMDEAHIIYDGNLAGFKSSSEKIEQAFKARHNVKILHVYRDVVEAFRAVIDRAMRIGRTVPIRAHIYTHRESLPTVRKLNETYGKDPRFSAGALDNSRGKNRAVMVDLDQVPVFDYTGVESKLREELEAARSDGRASEAVYRGILESQGTATAERSERLPLGRVQQETLPGALRQPQQERPRGHSDRLDAIRRALAPQIEALSPILRFEVVESTADLPDPSAPADVEGAYFQDGSIYLVAENLPTEQRAHEVFRHEVFGHMAVERNERLHKVFRQVERSITVGGLQDLVREVRARQGLLDGLTEAREVVALMAERGTRNPLMRDLAAAVRAVGAELGLDMNLDEADLTRLVGVAARDLKRDVAIMHDFQAAAGTSAAQALNKAEPTDEEILAAIDAIYEGRGDQLDSRPKGRRVSDIQDFGDLALTEELQVEGEEGLVEVTQSAQRAFEQARDRVKHLERLRECLLGS